MKELTIKDTIFPLFIGIFIQIIFAVMIFQTAYKHFFFFMFHLAGIIPLIFLLKKGYKLNHFGIKKFNFDIKILFLFLGPVLVWNSIAGRMDFPMLDQIVMNSSFSGKAFLLFQIGIMAPILEEINFRGILQNSLGNTFSKFGNIVSILIQLIVTTFLFSFLHAFAYVSIALGLLFSIGYVVTKNVIYPGMIVHSVNNIIVVGLFIFF